MNTSPASDSPNLVPGFLLPSLMVEDLTLEGRGLARYEGRVVFLDSGLPGEVVEARVTGLKKRLVLAQVTRTLQPSGDEVAPFCPHFGICGGCALQHYAYPKSLAWKAKQVRENLRRIGGQDLEQVTLFPAQASPKTKGFRNKMTYAFGFSAEGEPVLGLREHSAHSLVEVTSCGLQDAPAMMALEKVREFTKAQAMSHWDGKAGELRHLIIRTPEFAPSGERLIYLEAIVSPQGAVKAEAWREFAQNLMGKHLGSDAGGRRTLAGFILSERATASALAQGERILFTVGSPTLQEAFGPLMLEVPHNAFLQTNTELAGLLYAEAAKHAALTGAESVWDLFCGAGALGLYLAPQAKSVYGLDAQQESIQAARDNATRLGYAHCRFEVGDAAKTLAAYLEKNPDGAPDLIVADPPRAGLGPSLCGLLATLPARRLIYISCDPGTLARDIRALAPAWKLASAQAFDMFPHTPHVETLAVLER